MRTVPQRKTSLHPLLTIAAIAVILLSGLGIASLTGVLPQAHSNNVSLSNSTSPQGGVAPPDNTALPANTAAPSQAQMCPNCGVIAAVTPYQVKGSSSGLGAVTGGVVGGLIGNTIGAGTGHVLAIVAGAGGGAFAGNEIEKNANKHTRYKLTVQMNDGSTRVFHVVSSSWRPGDQVRVNGDHLAVAN